MTYASETFERDLKKIGLSAREAAVYVAALSLGPSPVQTIARKAKVARATTYLVLDSLTEMGLVTRYSANQRTQFVAEPPHQLDRLIDKREQELQAGRNELKRLMPKLEAFAKSADDRPVVRYYEGVEGLKAMRSEMTMRTNAGDVWYNFSPSDYLQDIFGKEGVDYKSRSLKGIKQKTIFTTRSEELKQEVLRGARKSGAERKFIDPEEYGSTSGVTVFNSHVAIGTLKGKIGGVVIESESIARMMRELFELTWKRLD